MLTPYHMCFILQILAVFLVSFFSFVQKGLDLIDLG